MEADNLLVEKAKNGNMAAFSELVLRHQKSLLRLAFRVVRDLQVAQDVVQESFLKAYQKLHSFEGRAAFKSWLFQITLNTAKNKLRAKTFEALDIEKTPVTEEFDVEEIMMNADLKEMIQGEIKKLPNKQRLALNLRIFDDLSFAEIADVMACPYDTAKANYRHALMKLRHRLGETLAVEGWHVKTSKNLMEVDA
jgi:RNA polymerase sigma-70 factor, ECF subfamily